MTGKRQKRAKAVKAAKAKHPAPTLAELEEAERKAREDLAYRLSDPDGLIGDDLPDDPDDIDAYSIRDFGCDLQAEADAWIKAYDALMKAQGKDSGYWVA